MCPDVAVDDGRGGGEIQHLQGTEELGQCKLILLWLHTVRDSKLKLTVCDGGDANIPNGKALEALVYVNRRTFDDVDTRIGVQKVAHQSSLSRSG